MEFVNKLHEAGIGVIMDFVPVHFVKDNFALARFDGTRCMNTAIPVMPTASGIPTTSISGKRKSAPF